MTREGDIHSPEAYAQGKMLDHSGWYGKLPRGCRPSDIDFGTATFVFDNHGSILLGEMSSVSREWRELAGGQKWLYESLVRFSPHCSVLCYHNVPLDRRIKTDEDVISFQPMVWDYDFVVGKVYSGGERWNRFVFSWYKDSLKLRRFLITEHYDRVLKDKYKDMR